ncbi:MAG: protein kinase [Polyangiaceae bacterium]
MDCLSEGRIQGIVEGGLDTLERERAREHLEDCADCRKLVGHAAAVLASGEAETDELEPLGSAFQPLEPGDRVGRYVVDERLGAGAMGVVYAATDSLLQRSVALKLLRPTDGGGDLERARLEREARAASAVKHPGVVAVYDVLATEDGLSVLVMDRVAGISLRQHLRDSGPLEAAEVREVFSQILEALSAAHRTGVVHRDLKPENVFLTEESGAPPRVKLLDFGVAKLLASAFSDSAGLTKSGTLVGTPYYMAPEQAFGATDLDQRADLWAVGVMLYEALVGERPLHGENVGQVLHHLAHFDFSGPRARLMQVAPSWEPLVSRLLVERSARLSDAQEALDCLRGIDLSGEASAAARLTDAATRGSHVASLSPKKSRAWWAVPLVLGLGGLFSLGFVTRGGPSGPAQQTAAPAADPAAFVEGPLATNSQFPTAKATPVSATDDASVALPEAPKRKPRAEPAAQFKPESPKAAVSAARVKPLDTPAAPTPAPADSARKPRLLTEPPF